MSAYCKRPLYRGQRITAGGKLAVVQRDSWPHEDVRVRRYMPTSDRWSNAQVVERTAVSVEVDPNLAYIPSPR